LSERIFRSASSWIWASA